MIQDKVKQGWVIYGKEEGLSVFRFYMVKKLTKFLNGNLSVKDGGGGRIY